MSNPPATPTDERCPVIGHDEIAAGHWMLTLEAPLIATSAKPGQFVNLKISDDLVPLLRRPLSICSVDTARGVILLVYRVVGSGTEKLSHVEADDKLSCLGPLGRPFDLTSGGPMILVGGGVGMPPLYFAATRLPRDRVRVVQGARDAQTLLFKEEFKMMGVDTVVTTEDGGEGIMGLVTDVLGEVLDDSDGGAAEICCGPTPMMKAVAAITRDREVATQVSLEERMACGFGVCVGCPVWIAPSDGSEQRYARVCTEGPVFDATEVFAD